MNQHSEGDALAVHNLQMMMEVGRFCGMAAAGSPPDEVHARFDSLCLRIQEHFAEEEGLVGQKSFHAEANKKLHALILVELEQLHEVLEVKGMTLNKDQLHRLRTLFMAEGELDSLIEGDLRRGG